MLNTITIKETRTALFSKLHDALGMVTYKLGTAAGLDYISINMLMYGIDDTVSVNEAVTKVLGLANVKVSPTVDNPTYGNGGINIIEIINLVNHAPIEDDRSPRYEEQDRILNEGPSILDSHDRVVALALHDLCYSLMQETDAMSYMLTFINGLLILDLEDYGCFDISKFLELVGYPVPYQAVMYDSELTNRLRSLVLIPVDFPRPFGASEHGLL